eukprot:12044158-Alexandrium_andersonii.AAC.1
MQDVIRAAAAKLSNSEAKQLLDAGLGFLRAWVLLSIRARRMGIPRYQLKPKHHHLEEGLRETFRSKRNPTQTWCCRHEHFVGITAKLAGKVHVSTATRRVLQRWLLSWGPSVCKVRIPRGKLHRARAGQ